jgi:hypothetical protein
MMNNDEMVLTMNIRYLLTMNAKETALLGVIKNRVNVINNRRENNCEPYAGCPCDCPINITCTQCWSRAIARFVCIEDNAPVL